MTSGPGLTKLAEEGVLRMTKRGTKVRLKGISVDLYESVRIARIEAANRFIEAGVAKNFAALASMIGTDAREFTEVRLVRLYGFSNFDTWTTFESLGRIHGIDVSCYLDPRAHTNPEGVQRLVGGISLIGAQVVTSHNEYELLTLPSISGLLIRCPGENYVLVNFPFEFVRERDYEVTLSDGVKLTLRAIHPRVLDVRLVFENERFQAVVLFAKESVFPADGLQLVAQEIKRTESSV